MPRNKTELLELLHKKLARRFHSAYFNMATAKSNLGRWEKVVEEKELAIAYKVAGFEFYYEPIYVARADTPPFDEMFVGYGMTRNTQVRVDEY